MEIASRYKRPLYITEWTTPGIAARVAGVNIITFKKWLREGRLPAFKNPTDTGDSIVRVRDIITYCIRNDVPFDRDMISSNKIPKHFKISAYVTKIYAVNLDTEEIPYTPKQCIVTVNLKQFLNCMEFDPFEWFAIGNKDDAADIIAEHTIRSLEGMLVNLEAFCPHIGYVEGSENGNAYSLYTYSGLSNMVKGMPLRKEVQADSKTGEIY